MDLSNLRAPKGATRKRKRKGRGPGSGLGKTAGKGHKGQKARSGGGTRPGFEGGQMPLQMRLPKRGFTNKFSKEVAILNLSDLERTFESGDTVDLESLCRRGMIPARILSEGDQTKVDLKVDAVKILGKGELTKSLTVRVHRFSKSAAQAIEAAGGTAEAIA